MLLQRLATLTINVKSTRGKVLNTTVSTRRGRVKKEVNELRKQTNIIGWMHKSNRKKIAVEFPGNERINNHGKSQLLNSIE